MPTFLANLITRRDQIGTVLASRETADGQSLDKAQITIDGETLSTDNYVQRLYSELRALNQLIGDQVSSVTSEDDVPDPFMDVTQGDT